MNAPLLVVQPSDDYAHRVRKHFPEAVILATPERAALLKGHPRVIPADLNSFEAALAAVRQYAREQGLSFAGVVCFVCERLLLTAHLARRLGLPFHDRSTVERTRYKDRMVTAWRASGVPAPPSYRVQELEDLLGFAGVWTEPPWILKPTDRSGSEWVLKVDRPEDLPAAHEKISAGLAGPGRAVAYLAQAFISGREISADLYVDNGRTQLLRLTEKYLVPQNGLAGLVGAYYPARLDAEMRSSIQDAFGRAAAALGVSRGIVMVDAILRGRTPYLLEMALRPGGDCLPDLSIHATGYDPVYTACRAALGLPPDPVDLERPAPVAALHLMADRSGTIDRIDFTRLQAHPGVLQFEPYRLPGDTVRRWDGSYDDRILASCVVRCEDMAELPALVETLAGRIDLHLQDDSTPDPTPERKTLVSC